MYEIKQITGEDILIRYAEIKIEIDRALAPSDGEWTSVQVVSAAIKNPDNYHIWDIIRDGKTIAIGSTRIIHYNNFTSLHIITLGGSDLYDDMPDLVTDFEKMVKEYEHIDYLEYTGRRGFIKQLTKVGWNERYVVMRKHLKET